MLARSEAEDEEWGEEELSNAMARYVHVSVFLRYLLRTFHVPLRLGRPLFLLSHHVLPWHLILHR